MGVEVYLPEVNCPPEPVLELVFQGIIVCVLAGAAGGVFGALIFRTSNSAGNK